MVVFSTFGSEIPKYLTAIQSQRTAHGNAVGQSQREANSREIAFVRYTLLPTNEPTKQQ